jgi:hypothetical protein
MTDTFVIPFGTQLLVFDADQLARALARGAHLVPPAPVATATATTTALLSSQQMQDATGVPKTWFERQARERRIPFRKLGRYVRFDLREVSDSEPFQRQAVPEGGVLANCAGHHNRRSVKK